MSVFHQAALNLPVRSLTGRGDFFTAPANAAAVALIDAFPNGFSGAVIYGEKGCGKTHLAHLFCQTVMEKTGRTPVITPFEQMEKTLDATDADQFYVVLENVRHPIDEPALFHLLNTAKGTGGFVLMTSDRPPAGWGLKLPDLITRLKALPCVEICPPDEMLMQAVLVKQFSDRQLKVAPEVIAYLLKNMERSFATLSAVVQRADELSLERKNAVTVPLIKQVLAETGGNDG